MRIRKSGPMMMLLTTKVLLCAVAALLLAVSQALSEAETCPLSVKYLQSKAPILAVANVKSKCKLPTEKSFCESCYCSVSHTGAQTFGQQLSSMSASEAEACGLALSMALMQLGALDLSSATALNKQCSPAIIQRVASSDVCQKYLPPAAHDSTQLTTQSTAPAPVPDVSRGDASAFGIGASSADSNTTVVPAVTVIAPVVGVVASAATGAKPIAGTPTTQQATNTPAEPTAPDNMQHRSTATHMTTSNTIPIAGTSAAAVAAPTSTTPKPAGIRPALNGTSGTAAAGKADSRSSSNSSSTINSFSSDDSTIKSARAAPPRNTGTSASKTHQAYQPKTAATAAAATIASRRAVSSCLFAVDDISQHNLTVIRQACDLTQRQHREFCSVCSCAVMRVQALLTGDQSAAGPAPPHRSANAGRVQELAAAAAVKTQDAQLAATVAAAVCADEVIAAATKSGDLTAEAAKMLNSDMCRYVPVVEKHSACSLGMVPANTTVRSGAAQVAGVPRMMLCILAMWSAWLIS